MDSRLSIKTTIEPLPTEKKSPGSIAIFIPSLRGGGAERVMMILANDFSARGYPTDLLLAKDTGPYRDQLSAKVNVIDFGSDGVLKALLPLYRYLKKHNPDVLLSAMTHSNIVSLWAGKLSGANTRLVVSERNALPHDQGGITGMQRFGFPLLTKAFYPWAHAIVCVSQGLSDDLIQKTPRIKNKVYTVYNPVVTEELLNRKNERVKHPWFDEREKTGCRVVLAAGRLNEQKDFGTLIKAISNVKKRLNVKLIILGEGSLRRELEQLIAGLDLGNTIDLYGFANNPFAFMKQADLFVLSSRWEGLPGVLIQAMACGTPVVSTDCPHGPAEILENGTWGKMVAVGDANALANAIIETLTNPSQPDVSIRASDFGQETASSRYLEVMGLKAIT